MPYKTIGKTISKFATEKDLRVMPAFLGHGIGSFFHGQPDIYHFSMFDEILYQIYFLITLVF